MNRNLFIFFCFLFFCSTHRFVQPAKIAILIPENGNFARYGEMQKQGYQLAEVLFSDQTKSIEVRYFDIGFLAKSKREFLEEKVLAWKPDLLIGAYSSENTNQILSLLPPDIPVIIPSATLDSLTQSYREHVFRVSSPSKVLAYYLAEFIDKNKTIQFAGYDEIVILAEVSSFGKIAKENIYNSLISKGIENISIHTFSKKELPIILEKLSKKEKFVTIFISRSYPQSFEIVEKLEKKSKIIGFLAASVTSTFQKFIQTKKKDIYIFSPWYKDFENPKVYYFTQNFSNKYQDAFSQAKPEYHNVQAFSSLQIAIEALNLSKNKNVSVQKILQDETFFTPLGKIKFDNFDGFFQQAKTDASIQFYEKGELKIISKPEDISSTIQKKRMPTEASSFKSKKSFFQILLGNQFIALFFILSIGLLLGRIEWKGISFGSSGVLFIALLLGHFHFTIPSGVGTLGLILFIFCVGLSAGPGFFRAFASQGVKLAQLAIVTVSSGVIVVIILSKFFEVPVDLAAGIFAGSLTSTPALAASLELLKDVGSGVSVGYGIAYPFGVVGIILFVQVLPRLLKQDLMVLSSQEKKKKSVAQIASILVQISNPLVIGKKIEECNFFSQSNCRVTHTLKNNRLLPIKSEMIFQSEQVIALSGEEKNIKNIVELLGTQIEQQEHWSSSSKDQREVVITSKKLEGKTLKELKLLYHYGIVVIEIIRNDISFIPTEDTKLELCDTVKVVGEFEGIQKFATTAGNNEKALHVTDILSLCLGILAGITIGLVPISIGGSQQFTLGLSGGLLLFSLLLGHYGKIGKIAGRIPFAARALMMELGLIFFLANAGIKAGKTFLSIIQQYGVQLFLVGFLCTSIPLIISYLFARYFLKISFLQSLGGVCGSMTSTPALGTIKSKCDSDTPVVSYAAAYPVSLILMLFSAQIIVLFLK